MLYCLSFSRFIALFFSNNSPKKCCFSLHLISSFLVISSLKRRKGHKQAFREQVTPPYITKCYILLFRKKHLYKKQKEANKIGAL